MFGCGGPRLRSACRRLGSTLLALVALLLTVKPASARPLRVELEWRAPAICPDREQVLATIRSLTGGAAPDDETSSEPADATLDVNAEVTSRERTFVLELSWRTTASRRTRTMESSNCQDLARAAALIVALASTGDGGENGDGAATPKVEHAPQPAAVSSAARVPLTAPPSPRRAPVRRPPPRAPEPKRKPMRAPASELALRGALALENGSLPRSAAGVIAGAGFNYGYLAAQADVALFAPQMKGVAEGAGRFWLGQVALRPCGVIGERYRAGLCLAGELNMLWGSGRRVDFRRQGVALFPRLGPALTISALISPHLRLSLGAQAAIAPARPRFFVQDGEEVFRPALWSSRFGLGFDFLL